MLWHNSKRPNRRGGSRPVAYRRDAAVPRAVGAAEHFAVGFDAVPDNPAAAVDANGRQGVNGTLKAIECVHAAFEVNFQNLVVLIAADFTSCHGDSPDY
jgi:hypothetical protein